MERIKLFGGVIKDRSDTMRSAGFYEDENGLEPLTAGYKTNISVFVACMLYKWYRSIFINKMAIWERQPQWNTVMTSKEQEEKANLKAMTCNNCGTTIFIAKGRKWFQMPKDYECYSCGASGDDAFTDIRADVLEDIEDDYFDYEKPLDFVSAAERRKLMKEAGGDEEKANAMLTQGDAKNIGQEEGDAAPKKKKKKKKGKKKKKKAVEVDDEEAPAPTTKEVKADIKKSEDGLDEFDLDAL